MHVNNETGTFRFGANGSYLSRAQRFISFGYRAIHRKTSINLQTTIPVISLWPVRINLRTSGVGFAFVEKFRLQPYFGGERKGLRAGTEALHKLGIASRTLHSNLVDREHITELQTTSLPNLKLNFQL
jgi:cysteine sulfinate desulfinase/cysteine desulfurase-like protein